MTALPPAAPTINAMGTVLCFPVRLDLDAPAQTPADAGSSGESQTEDEGRSE